MNAHHLLDAPTQTGPTHAHVMEDIPVMASTALTSMSAPRTHTCAMAMLLAKTRPETSRARVTEGSLEMVSSATTSMSVCGALIFAARTQTVTMFLEVMNVNVGMGIQAMV